MIFRELASESGDDWSRWLNRGAVGERDMRDPRFALLRFPIHDRCSNGVAHRIQYTRWLYPQRNCLGMVEYPTEGNLCRGDVTQKTPSTCDHVPDIGLRKLLNEANRKCGDMQPPFRCEMQAGETSQPLLRDRGERSHLWRVSQQYVPVQHALSRAGFCPALPAVGHLARQVRQASPLGAPRNAPELNALICSLIRPAAGSRWKRCCRNRRSISEVYATTVAMRNAGSSVRTGASSPCAAPRSPLMMCATPAPSRTCAQVAATQGSPRAHA